MLLLALSTFSRSSPRRKNCGIQMERTISVLYDKYKVLLELLEKTIESTQGWDDASISQASGLYHVMNSFLFCFLIQVFNRILEQSALLYMVLQNRNTDFSHGGQKIATFADLFVFCALTVLMMISSNQLSL